jgi:hypothetical protein
MLERHHAGLSTRESLGELVVRLGGSGDRPGVLGEHQEVGAMVIQGVDDRAQQFAVFGTIDLEDPAVVRLERLVMRAELGQHQLRSTPQRPTSNEFPRGLVFALVTHWTSCRVHR